MVVIHSEVQVYGWCWFEGSISLEHVQFEMQVRYESYDGDQQVEPISLDFRRVVHSGDMNLEIISIQMTFKEIGMDEITKQVSVGDQRRGEVYELSIWVPQV